MKVKLPKLTEEQIREIAANPESKIDIADPWWLIVLKAIGYLIGLIIAGSGTAAAATILIN